MTDPAVPSAVLFDLDGVLIDSERLYYRAYSQVLAEFGVSVTPEVYGREWIAAGTGPEYAVREFDLPISPEEVRERKNPIFHQLIRDEVELMPGVLAVLDRLGNEFPLVVATNSRDADVSYTLERFGIRDRFVDVVCRERYARSKPAPDAFLAGAEAVELEPARCVVIEDAWKGVKAAHDAGCPIIAVPHELTANNDFSLADRVVSSLDEVTPELVRELTGGQ